MNVLINHCWCSDSNWGGRYDCRVIVGIDRIGEGKTYYDPPASDWTNLLEKHPTGRGGIDDMDWGRETYRLKLEITQWLNDNIRDRRLTKQERENNGHKQGWGVGTDQYNSRNCISFNLFFERTSDALKFIKRWSSYGKPVDYLNYFRDVRKKLNLKTNRLVRVAR